MHPILEPIPNSDVWKLKHDFLYLYKDKTIVVPAGFKTDGATMPRVFFSLLVPPYHPKVMRATLVHDYLHIVMNMDLREADKIFHDILVEDGVNKIKAKLMYHGVWCYSFLKRNFGFTF